MPSPNPDPPSTVILRAERLTLLRGGRAVVKDVDLTLEPGARVGVMGPSGAGKSSLARMLVGETRPSSGTVQLFGEELRPARRDLRRRIPLVAQDPEAALDPLLTADGVLAPFAGPPRRREVLDQVGLSRAMSSRRTRELSGGQQQRLVLARALLVEPAALVLDEPTSALDRPAARAVADLVAELGLPYVCVSHDVGLLARLTEELLVLSEGEVVEQGPTAAILARPQHPTTMRIAEAAAHLRLGLHAGVK